MEFVGTSSVLKAFREVLFGPVLDLTPRSHIDDWTTYLKKKKKKILTTPNPTFLPRKKTRLAKFPNIRTTRDCRCCVVRWLINLPCRWRAKNSLVSGCSHHHPRLSLISPTCPFQPRFLPSLSPAAAFKRINETA